MQTILKISLLFFTLTGPNLIIFLLFQWNVKLDLNKNKQGKRKEKNKHVSV